MSQTELNRVLVLVIELRLAGAKNCEEANRVLNGGFIERYNKRFAVPPADSLSAFRPVPSHLRLEHIFCWKEYRTLNLGYTVQYAGKTYQVLTPQGTPIIPLRSVVEVHKLPDNRLYAAWNGHIYPLKLLEQNLNHKKVTLARIDATTSEKAGSALPRRPALDHPWPKPWKMPQPNLKTLTKSLTSFT